MDVFWNPEKFLQFLPIFIRTSFFVFAVPMFSSQVVIPIIRLGLSFSVALAIYSGLSSAGISFSLPVDLASIFVGILSELFISFLIFLIIRIFLTAPQLSGEAMSYQLGYGFMTITNPFEENPLSVISEFFFFISMVIFFVLDLHIGFFWGLKESFKMVPPFYAVLNERFPEFFNEKISESFAVSVQIALPILLASFIVEISTGIVSRTIPQFNIFVVGFPIKILIGLFLLAFTFDRIAFLIGEFLKKFIEVLSDSLKLSM